MKNIFMGKSFVIRLIVVALALGIPLSGILFPHTINADSEKGVSPSNSFTTTAKNHLKFCGLDKVSYQVVKKVTMVLTAYSSTPDQTDDTPFITASGKYVADGIVANNMLPFGTKIRIPDLYGGKIFTVEDRMHQRKGNYQADIWMTSYQQAKTFGSKVASIEILQD